MRVDVLTIFPEMFRGPLDVSIVGRARAEGHLELHVHDLREHARDRHRLTDDYPFGGGSGMVMKPEPFFQAFDALAPGWPGRPWVVLLSPQGERLTQRKAVELSGRPFLCLLCGRYEGIDERVREGLVDEEISIGDYVLTGGELPAMVLIDAVARLLPGVLGSPASVAEESFTGGLLEYPQYTRPRVFRGMAVPDVLLSGDHGAVRRWRRKQSLCRTALRRPDLLLLAPLDAEDRRLLRELKDEGVFGDGVPAVEQVLAAR